MSLKSANRKIPNSLTKVRSAPPVHILSKTNPNPDNPIVEDILDNQPPNRQSSTAIPAEEKE